jgi:hypothetical protein
MRAFRSTEEIAIINFGNHRMTDLYERFITTTIASQPENRRSSELLLLHTALTLYPRRSIRGISDIPPRRPRFTKIA